MTELNTKETFKKEVKNTSTESTETVQQEVAKTPESETVSIPKSQYEEMLAGLASIKNLEEKIKFIGDKDRLARFEETQGKKKNVLPVAGISSIDGKKILGWRTVSNEAEFRNGLYFEKQVVEVSFQDQSVIKMDLSEFYRQKRKISGEVISTKTTEEGSIFWTLRLADGEEITVGIEFIN